MKYLLRCLATSLTLVALNSSAELLIPINEGQTISNSIEIKEKTFFQEKIRAKIQLPSGDWNVRHIQKVYSTGVSPQEGRQIWLDKVIDKNISENFLIELYESNSINWNISCSTGIVQKLNVGGFNTDCFSVDMKKFMADNNSKTQTEVRKKWSQNGFSWTTNSLSYNGIFQRRGYGNFYIYYSIPTKGIGIEDTDLIQNSKLLSSNINKIFSKDEIDYVSSWYKKYHQNLSDSIYTYEQKEFDTKVDAVESPYAFLLDVVRNKFSAYKLESSTVAPQANLSEEQSKRKQTELEEQLRLAQQQSQTTTPVATAPSIGKRIALVVGNASYKVRPLKNPLNDADDISRSLRSSGFEVIELRDASLQQMRSGVRQFGDRLINNDVGLVYYSGHGVEVKGRNYFIPVNADIMREDEIADQGLDVSLILEKMNTAGKGVNILIVDACRDDPFGRSFRSTSRGLAQMDAPRGTIIAYATSPGKVASDGDGRNSPYTKNLVRAMQQPNKPIEQVFKEVRRAVQEETKNQQTPWENTSLSGDFYFKVQR
jgi:hypothetical protein